MMNGATHTRGAALKREEPRIELEAGAALGQVVADDAAGNGDISRNGPHGTTPSRAGVRLEPAYGNIRAAERLVAAERAAVDGDGRRRGREERAAADSAADRRADHGKERRAAAGVTVVAAASQVVA